MREIVGVQVGQCGNQMGSQFFKVICDESGLNEKGQYCGNHDILKQSLNNYFKGDEKNRYQARCILVDLEPTVLDAIKTSPYGKVFNQDNFVQGAAGAGNNWARGYYTYGQLYSEIAIDRVRKEVEDCDCLQGLQFIHSLGGGTGAGTGSLLITKLREEYPDRIMKSYSVVPSQAISVVVVEPYNYTLATHYMIENTDMCVHLDNEAMYSICVNTCKIFKPSYSDLNQLAGNAMSGVTCGLRFPGQLNNDLRKLAVNLIPYPRLHFFIPGFAPLFARGVSAYRNTKVEDLTKQMFDPKNMLCACDPSQGKYLTIAALYRGRMSTQTVDQCIADIQNRNADYFASWIPNNVKTAICDIPPKGLKMASCFLGNNTAMKDIMKRVIQQFSIMFKRKAFLHTYCGEGMDECEFTESESNLLDLIAEYQQHGEAEATYEDEATGTQEY